MPPLISPIEETLAKIKSASIESGDSFRVKIYRKRTMTNLPDNIATLDGATLAHIASPEVWMGRLAGGGTYQISVYRPEDPSLPIGGPIVFSINSPAEPKDVDPAVLRQPGWQGPPICVFPEASDRGPQPAYSVGSPAGIPNVQTPQTNVPGGNLPGNQFHQAPAGTSANEAYLRAQLDDMSRRFAEAERRSDEQRRQVELDRIRADSDAKLREIQLQNEAAIRRLEAQAAAATAAASAPKNGSNLAEILAAVAPLVTQVMQQSAEDRKMQTTILTSLLSKPAIDPALQAILLERNNSKSESVEMLNAMPAMMTSMSKMAMTVADAVSELSGPPEPKEAPGVAIAREISKAVQTIGMGLSAQARAKQAPSQPALPPGSYEARATQPPPPPPNNQPTQAFAGPPQATNGKHPANALEQPVPQPKGPRLVVDEVERMIRAKQDPKAIIHLLIDNLQNDQVQRELIAADGDFQEMFARRLVDFWPIEENQPYLVELFTTFQSEGEAAGIFEDESGEEGPVVEGETVDGARA